MCFLLAVARGECFWKVSPIRYAGTLCLVITRLSAVLLLLASAGQASTFYFLARNERICAVEEAVCIRGTISYDTNSRLLHLRGRVERAPGTGWLRLTFVGVSERNQRGSTTMEFPIRGRCSEVLDRKLVPDHPQIDDWRLEVMAWFPDERDSRPHLDPRS